MKYNQGLAKVLERRVASSDKRIIINHRLATSIIYALRGQDTSIDAYLSLEEKEELLGSNHQ